MSDTPKATRSRGRLSLAFNKRLSKRLASPQNKVNSRENSPSLVINLENDDGTPPHKKPNLDDSCDSPVHFENSYSPTAFLSQSLYPDSPEIGWRWSMDGEDHKKRNKNEENEKDKDEEDKIKRLQAEARLAYLNKLEEKRRQKLLEMRRADKMRSQNILRERLLMLEEQFKVESSLKTVEIQNSVESCETNSSKDFVNSDSETRLKSTEKSNRTLDLENFDNWFDDSITFETIANKDTTTKQVANGLIDNIFDDSITFEPTNQHSTSKEEVNKSENFDDFFNDTETDGLLLAATQKLEAKIPELTQPTVFASMPTEIPSSKTEINKTTSKTNKEKRSSFCMKFFEDEDDDDDLFASLDDAWLLKATQTTKPRSPFQRYKSMPTTATVTSSITSTIKSSTSNSCDRKTTECPAWSLKNGLRKSDTATATATSHIKRHASNHELSPSTTKISYKRR